MPLPSLRRLALRELNEPALRRLIEHGEDLFVERKREPPTPPGLGAEVASFANTLGGWLLLGVQDDGKIVGWAPPPRTDLQSHIGNLLRNQLDPVPPYLADTHEIDTQTITILRVFESTDTPVIVRSTGAVYVRDAGGKHPVRDHRVLVDLARRGERARAAAQARLRQLPIITRALRGPYDPLDNETGPDLLGATVKLAPLTVTPTLEDWALSEAGPTWAEEQVMVLVPRVPQVDQHGPITRPFGRGFGTSRLREHPTPIRTVSIVADAGGVIGPQSHYSCEAVDLVETTMLRDEQIIPLLTTCADALTHAESYGEVVADLWVMVPTDVRLMVRDGSFQQLSNPGWFYAGGRLTVPADPDEIEALAAAWTRELMREGNRPEWEPRA